MCVEVHFEKGAIGALHSHPHEQITYIISGEFEFNIGGEKKVLKAGDSTFKQPDIEHGAVCLKVGMLLDIFTPCREDLFEISVNFEEQRAVRRAACFVYTNHSPVKNPWIICFSLSCY